MSKKFIEKIEQFDIFFEALEEYTPLSELFPEETEEQLKDIESENYIFCAKISIEKCGLELSADYLGGCVYEKEEDFYIKYKDEYYSDIKRELLSNARIELQNLIKKLQS